MHCNLLLVDDEPNVPRAIRRSLRNEGYHFLIAGSADEAFDLLRATPVDVVISDHRMPGKTGSEFLAEVSRDFPDTVRLMLSGQADIEAVIDAINEGNIYKFLSKPWDNDRLRQIVRTAADKARARHVDAHTGWHTLAIFQERISALLEEQPLRIVTGEVRNIATVWALLNAEQRLTLAEKIEQRCVAATGEPLIPLAALDRGLFGFALPAGGPCELMEGAVERLTAPMIIDDQALSLQVALGYVDSNQVSDNSAESLITNAIMALASVGASGKSFASYRTDTSDDLKLHQTLEHDLQGAIAKAQLYLQLQPQVSTKSMCITGAEALIRWRHPEHGLISPTQFIEMAERNGFINDIGVWVVCTTMQHLETLHDLGINDVRVSLNVSPRQFTGGVTAPWVTALHQYAAEQPHLMSNLEIEVTESTIMDDPETAMQILADFKALGIRVALDDFGTGHASFAQLKGFPLDVLKLDRSLIQDVDEDERSMTLLKHLAEMAADLGLETVAEGVETDAQVAACKSLGCDLIQGYAFYKPLDVEDFYRVVRSERHAHH